MAKMKHRKFRVTKWKVREIPENQRVSKNYIEKPGDVIFGRYDFTETRFKKSGLVGRFRSAYVLEVIVHNHFAIGEATGFQQNIQLRGYYDSLERAYEQKKTEFEADFSLI
jgi:hypothetical protein